MLNDMKKMRSILLMCMIAGVGYTMTACGSSEPATAPELSHIPSWYNSPPADNAEYLYVVTSAESPRREMARQRAQQQANAQMAQKLGAKVEALQKLFEEEIQSGDDFNYSAAFTNANRTITNQELTGASIETQEFAVIERNGQQLYEAFILYRLPVGEARSQLDNALSREEEMYVRFKESQAFNELENNLERLAGE